MVGPEVVEAGRVCAGDVGVGDNFVFIDLGNLGAIRPMPLDLLLDSLLLLDCFLDFFELLLEVNALPALSSMSLAALLTSRWKLTLGTFGIKLILAFQLL